MAMKEFYKRSFAVLLFFWCVPAFSQAPAFTILNSDSNPVPGAVLIFKALDPNSTKHQELYFTDENGIVTNNLSAASLLIIHCFGYSDFSDTVETGKSYTFHLEKEEMILQEVVVTGQYDINTSDKSLYNVKVIDAKTIQLMAAQNLSDVLRNQIAARLSQDNLLGSSAQIDGIAGQNVKILVDGIPVIGRENGTIDLSQINMNNVERIEVIEGPMSVSYGTDALGGLINIVTKKSSSFPAEADLHLYYGTEGTYNGDGILFWKKLNHTFSLSGGRYFFDGFSTVDTSRYLQWKPKRQYFGAFNYNFSGKLISIGAKTEYFNEEIQNKGQPVLTPYQAYAFDDYYYTRRMNQALFIEWRLKNNAKLQLTNGYNNYHRIKNTFRKDLVTLDQELSSGEGSQDTSVFDEWTLRGTYSSVLPSRKINFQGGYDLNLQSGNGNNLTQGIQHLNDYAAFGSLEYQVLKNFYVRPGLRVAYNTRYGATFTPSVNTKMDFSDRFTLRASYAKGFRSPSLKELDLEFLDVNHNIHGNDSLKAETSDNFNITLTAKHKVASYDLKAEISLFYNNISNIITLALVNPVTQYYTYINVDQYKTRGTTFSAQFRMKNIFLATGFSLLGLYNPLSDSFTIDKFSLTPEFQGSAIWINSKWNAEAGLFFKNTGDTPGFSVDNEGNIYQTMLDSYSILDATVTKSFCKKHIALSAGVKNIFDITNLETTASGTSFHNEDGNSVPYAIGRFAFASLQLKLFKE